MPDFMRRFHALHSRERVAIRAQEPTVRGDGTTAVLRLYDPIDSYGGEWGVSAKEFASALDELGDKVDTIELHINSPGGEVFEATAILNLLRAHKARVVAVVDGVAASMASVIACGADELVMARNSEMFIHNAWALCVGNSSDMRQVADNLEHFDRNLAAVYAAKAGGTVEDWLAVADAETWYSADEALEVGLADRVDETPADEKAKARFDLSIFKTSDRGNAAGQQQPATHGGPSSPQSERTPAVAFSDEQFTNLRTALDLPADSDEATVFAALSDKLAEYVEEPPAPTPPTPSAATLPEGVVAISEAQLADLTAKAEAGDQARAEQIRNQRESLVSAAVRDGRIAPVERDAWLAKLESGTGAEQVLAALKPGLIPVEAVGTNGAADLDSDEALYAALYGPEVKA